MMKTDIKRNITEITFADDVIMEKLKIQSQHAPVKYAVFVDAATGKLYASDYTGGTGGGAIGTSTVESSAPFNQSMNALATNGDGSLATVTPILKDPIGRVDILINGLSVDIGDGKEAYFSSDGGITAKTRGEVSVGDKLYWNSSISNYELDIYDKIDFDYIISSSDISAPTMSIEITGGNWGTEIPGTYILSPVDYIAPPLEEWYYAQDSDNYIKLIVSESTTDLLNVAQVKINGILETYTNITPLINILDADKKIIDQLFRAYIVGPVTLTLSRGANWTSFTL